MLPVKVQPHKWLIHIRYGLLIALILTGWGIREAHRIVPQIRQTADKVVSLNNLSNVNMKIGGCIPIRGSL